MFKKTCLFFLLLTSLAARSQDAVKKVTKNYFRSDPFNTEFSSFIKHLINDPTIRDKEMYPRSDTGLFYLHGFYTTHNPFFFKSKKMEVVLAEIEMVYSDSLPKDTIMLYQLVAYVDHSEEGIKNVRKEFEKIHRQLARSFSTNNYKDEKSGGEVKAAWYNYFVPTHAVAPVTLIWGKANQDKDVILNLSIRMKSSYNRATLAAPLLPGG